LIYSLLTSFWFYALKPVWPFFSLDRKETKDQGWGFLFYFFTLSADRQARAKSECCLHKAKKMHK
jgi:hypothetical protein